MSGSENKRLKQIRYVACQIEGCEEYSNMDGNFSFTYTQHLKQTKILQLN